MSRVLYYECFAGMSGDMNLAALIDLGVPVDYIRGLLKKLDMDEEFHLHVEPGFKAGMRGTIAHVHAHDGHAGHAHRSFADIRKMIECSSLSDFVKEKSVSIFKILAEAEGEAHGKSADEVHFHEVGAIDSIVDIVGGVIAVEFLKPDYIYSSTVELGGGTVKCAHGVMPVPAPATLLLSRFFPSRVGGTDHEATTPTGAAFLAAMVDCFNPLLAGCCEQSGTGLGHRDSEMLPNMLRVSLWDTDCSRNDGDEVECALVETNIDDMTPEHLSYLTDKLFDAGAMDVWQESIVMKKNRLGVKVCALVQMPDSRMITDVFFKHSSTLGVRVGSVKKYELERDVVARKTSYGEVRVKQAFQNGGTLKSKPEFEDCRRLSEEHDVSLRDITEAAEREY